MKLNQTARQIWPALLSMLLVACGGGGGGSASTPPRPPGNLATGDYFVYAMSVGDASGGPPVLSSTTNFVKATKADGSYSLVQTQTGSTPSVSIDATASGAWLAFSFGNVLACTYSPAYQFDPPLSLAAGDGWTSIATQSCKASADGSISSATTSLTGKVVGTEQVTVAAGSFAAIKATITEVIQYPGMTETFIENSWFDSASRQVVRTDWTYSLVPSGTTTPSSSGSISRQLTAYSHGGKSAGAVTARFAGLWNVSYTGTDAGTCTGLNADTNGGVSGSCSSNTSGAFNVTGTVDAKGVISLTASNGATMNGNFASPFAGTGTWINSGGANGAWSAVHQ